MGAAVKVFCQVGHTSRAARFIHWMLSLDAFTGCFHWGNQDQPFRLCFPFVASGLLGLRGCCFFRLGQFIPDEGGELMKTRMIRLVRHDGSDAGTAEIVTMMVAHDEIEQRLISRTEETLPAGRARGLHLAENHPEYGAVTYLQEILDGEFYVYVGTQENLDEHRFTAGDWVGFIDNDGLGHASRVGDSGCTRRFHFLRGQITGDLVT